MKSKLASSPPATGLSTPISAFMHGPRRRPQRERTSNSSRPKQQRAMKKNIFLYMVILLMGSACDAKHAAQPKPPNASETHRPVGQGTAPSIVVKNSHIEINGTQVWMGDSMESWKKALSGSPKCFDGEKGIAECVWDGITIGSDTVDHSRVKFVNVYMQLPELPYGIDPLPSTPTALFRGNLELDGQRILPTTQFRDLRRVSGPLRELRCGGSDCGNPSGAFDDGASIYMELDSRADAGKVTTFALSCSSTALCVSMLPASRK